MNYKNITVAGGGVLGSQIAFQTAFKGFEVCLYDINEKALEMADTRLKNYMERYREDIGANQEELEVAYNRIKLYTDLAKAVENADLVIEAIPELLEIKKDFYQNLANVSPDKTVFASNSSTLLPSQFAEFTGRPEKFLALHFANEIWKFNVAEIMKHSGTNEEIFQDVIEFAKAIGMVPIPIHKEQPGYVMNSLLIPFLLAAQTLLVNGISDPESIDKTWMLTSGAPFGPFAWLDIIGINTAYNVGKSLGDQGNEEGAKIADYLKREFIDKGKLGKQAGEGFYKYPNPRFLAEDFLK